MLVMKAHICRNSQNEACTFSQWITNRGLSKAHERCWDTLECLCKKNRLGFAYISHSLMYKINDDRGSEARLADNADNEGSQPRLAFKCSHLTKCHETRLVHLYIEGS